MAECMKTVVTLEPQLTVEERNLLSVAYKNVIGLRRSSWRIISSVQQKEETLAGATGAPGHLEIVRDYKLAVEKELKQICADILGLLDKFLIPQATDPESKVFLF